MDEIEFRKRVYASPKELDRETLDATRDNPAYQKILEQTRALELELDSLVSGVAVPGGLKEKLLAIPDTANGSNKVSNIHSTRLSFFQYYALAACLLLALGVSFSLPFNSRLSSSDLAFGNDILAHLYEDSEEISEINGGLFDDIVTLPEANESMAKTGTQLASNESMHNVAIRSAKPCEILPSFESAHLLVEGNQGAVSIIVINNSPVSGEYAIGDGRFNGIVIPMGDGNMILIGEKNENLDRYKALFSESVERIN